MKLKIIVIGILILTLVMGGVSFWGAYKEAYKSSSSSLNKNEDVVDNGNSEEFKLCENAITDLSEEQYDKVLDEMYDDVDEDIIEDIEKMEPEEINDTINSFDEEYELGESLSEKDQALLLYAYEQHTQEDKQTNNGLELLAWKTRVYNIGSNKKKDGVKVSYKGKFKTWSGAMHAKYDTDVHVTIEKGKSKLKSMKWTTYNNAYGILGSSGKSVSIGKVYSGHISSSKYKKNFSFEKSKTYSAVCTVYISTYGSLDVKYNGGEFSKNTKTYKSVE